MNTLTDRYLAATLRSVPTQRREELATELRASIEDMIDDRTGGGQDASAAERDVLTELGDPARLAARYADRQLHLIGPTYYLIWQRLLILLLSFVPAIVGTVVAVIDAAGGKGFGAIGTGIATALQVAVQIAFWVTLVFAIIERVQPHVDVPDWTVEQLPDAPVHRDVSLADTIASVAMLLLTIAYLPFQHYRSWIRDDAGDHLPLIDPALWSSWLPVLIAVLLAGVVFELVKYRVGHWTWPLFAGKALLNAAFAVPLIWLATTDRLLNPALAEPLTWLRDTGNRDTVGAIIAVSAVVVLVWDLIDTLVKTRRQTA
ncbi:permease prefix domain 1-containing protein [Micromonospora sp. GCM10011542]|uniref:permease prefix domain 1-containing protein n=1 Tax=Micromonospora sp. GCM10011542 TaxID=3317337 RepID=UPI00360700F3